ncbi:Ig domain-containing protein [SAR92 clade bacterium H455]|uniref:Ig domain-containing protein n=1 Tax=SAR92 clade bacterium H455 TaxID=2974818 RepID=A0ABY5TLE8_9GAMM|nr:Ig domain-containing protein [SAR92 clade bacterium H455]
MISRILLISAALLLMSCGGSGSGSSSDSSAGSGTGSSNTGSSNTDIGTVTLAGQTEVWSDQINWTLSATAEGLNSTDVSFQLAADNSGLEIDSTTGLIQGVVTTAGVYDLVITAEDSAGGSAAESFSFTSNAFIAGHWLMDLPSSNEQLLLIISRNGRASITKSSAVGEIDTICNGQLTILGDAVSGSLGCVDAELNRFALPASGTVVAGSSITLSDFSFADALGDALVEGQFLFQTQAEVFNFGTIVPGVYAEYSDIASGISLVKVTADGSLTAMMPSDVGFQNKNSRCGLSGSLEADVIFADYEIESLKSALQVFEANITLTDCDLGSTALDSLNYNQTQASALGASVLDTLADAQSFNLYFPGSGNSNESQNAGYFRYVQLCDESNQLTAIAALLKDDSEQFSIIACPVEEG